MTKSDLFPGLDDISFAGKDPAEIEEAVITGYESAAGRSLAKGDPVRLFLEAVALVIIQQRALIDYTGKQNLLAYAEGNKLDHLSAYLGVTRLAASSAATTLRFTLSEAQPAAIIIPAGTRVSPGGGELLFATVEDFEIPAGETEALILAQCETAGTAGNGFVAGQVRKLVDPFPWEMTVTNITETSGGADVENDENLRERTQIAPESFSVAGPKGEYIFHARSAHQSIVDVAVLGPDDSTEEHVIKPGNVEIYPLLTDGKLPSQEILDAVLEACSAEDVRPDTDYVHVLTPQIVFYDLSVSYWIDRTNATRAASIQSAVQQALEGWIAWQRTRLGRDINPSELTRRMVAAGAKRVEIASPFFTVLSAREVAILNGNTVTYGGLEDG